MKSRILLIDDDRVFLDSLKTVLEELGYNADTVNNSAEAPAILDSNAYDLVLLDIKMPGVNGIDLLKHSLGKNPERPVVIISGQSTISIAVEAMKLGAFDFIEKPVDTQRIYPIIKNALKFKNLLCENKLLSEELEEKNQLIGTSKAMNSVCAHIKLLAKTDAKVLIIGETGTGKEIVARAIQRNSLRKDRPYIKINCAAIPSELLESELFGHVKGSFTGAVGDKPGKIQAANNGTLFLDEIGDMPLGLQAKILRFLEEGEIEVVGKPAAQKTDVRVIAATNKDLFEMVKNGKFREDLYHRLNVVKIVIPPLRLRKEDIPELLMYFIENYNNEYNKSIRIVTDRAFNILKSYDWPGNVRELKNFAEKIVIYHDRDTIDSGDLLNFFQSQTDREVLEITSPSLTYKEAKEEFEKRFLQNALSDHNGNIAETAKTLGVDRSNLFKKIKSLGIEVSDWNE